MISRTGTKPDTPNRPINRLTRGQMFVASFVPASVVIAGSAVEALAKPLMHARG